MRTKRFFTLLMATMLTISIGYAQKASKEARNESKEAKKVLKENLSRNDVLKKELQGKAMKSARKDAKKYQKEGFKTFIGGIAMEKQIENAWMKSVDLDEQGFPKYLVTTSRVIGGNTSAAKMQAMHLAKVEMAGLISSNIVSLIEGSTANNELSHQEATSLNKALMASKELITADLGRVFRDVEVYRDLRDKNVEVMVCLSYNSRVAYEIAKRSMVQQLEDQTEDLHKKLDRILNLDKFEPKTNTNLQP